VKISRDKIKANINWLKLSFSSIEKFLIENSAMVEKLDYRLPNNLLPYKYDLKFKVQFDVEFENSFPYDGEMMMHFTCVKDTKDLIFHINKILVDNSTLVLESLTDSSYNLINGFSWKNDYERQFFVANLAQSFKANNNYTLSMKFTGYLASDNVGFYRSSYLSDGGHQVWLLASQMQPTDARKSFPCFDEPGMKATFKISVEHRYDYKAFSNMPIEVISQKYKLKSLINV
jgi:aminopeptidase N